MISITQVKLWEDDFVGSSVWWPFNAESGDPDLRPLIPSKKYTESEYLRMLSKLLPPGHIWEFPV